MKSAIVHLYDNPGESGYRAWIVPVEENWVVFASVDDRLFYYEIDQKLTKHLRQECNFDADSVALSAGREITKEQLVDFILRGGDVTREVDSFLNTLASGGLEG